MNTTTRAERRNSRMDKIWESAKRIESERLAKGEQPNPNLTDSTVNDRLISALERLSEECQASRKYIVLSDERGMEAYDATAEAILHARAAIAAAKGGN